MGLFDFIKKKQNSVELQDPVKENKVQKNDKPVIYFDGLTDNETIFKLLWFADGKFKNYDPEENQGSVFENELFRIKVTFINPEPSALTSKYPIKASSSLDANESIGYFPSYSGITPEQRWIYLNWLKDVRQQVDIGYVFIFYYGLERHLLYGNYKDAVDVILLLRKHHTNSSFQSYSLGALLLAAILHKDENVLERALDTLTNERPDNLVLIAKYLMKKGVTPSEIISMASPVGFKNKRYINQYPDMFKDLLSSKLESEFGESLYPVYNLDTDFEFSDSIAFANISLPADIRTQSLPNIRDNLVFKDSIMQLLSSTHAELKEKLADMRKEGAAPTPRKSTKSNVNDGVEYDSVCPYCSSNLDKPPKKKKKCPSCGNFMYVRFSRILFPFTYLTEDEAFATDEFYSLQEHGISKDDFFRKYEQIGQENYALTYVAIYEDLLLEETDNFQLQSIYFKLSLLHYKLGNEFTSYLQHQAKLELMDLKQSGFDKVKISSVGSCEACQKLDGRVLAISDALKERPIPCLECTHESEKGKPGWCMCRYVAVFDDSELD